jgi:hypothetical protein
MKNPDLPQRLREALAHVAGRRPLTSVTVQVDDSAGWHSFTGGTHDRDAAEIQQLYTDSLTAWRKNPMAKRIIDAMTDYCLGDGLTPTAAGTIGAFIHRWWTHPKNQMAHRLPELVDELSRAGDIFLTLHRNPEDGMSYVRPVPKDRIQRIETAPNDWETELSYFETQGDGVSLREWPSPAHPAAAESPAVMLHYAINRPVGALLGEGDLSTMIPWLLRYSRLLEDRVRLHWAARAFLWIVTVPPNKVREKMEQYRAAPDAGAVIVKDESEDWKAVNPDLKGMDSQFDLRAVRMMIDSGTGMPPHWRGEPHNISLATSRSMDRAYARHLRRRQLYLRFLVVDLAHIAYTRAWELGKTRAAPRRDAITAETADIDRQDNQELAAAARDIADALSTLRAQLPGQSPTLDRLFLRLVFRFAGEPLDDPIIDDIAGELEASAAEHPAEPPQLPYGSRGDPQGPGRPPADVDDGGRSPNEEEEE